MPSTVSNAQLSALNTLWQASLAHPKLAAKIGQMSARQLLIRLTCYQVAHWCASAPLASRPASEREREREQLKQTLTPPTPTVDHKEPPTFAHFVGSFLCKLSRSQWLLPQWRFQQARGARKPLPVRLAALERERLRLDACDWALGFHRGYFLPACSGHCLGTRMGSVRASVRVLVCGPYTRATHKGQTLGLDHWH